MRKVREGAGLPVLTFIVTDGEQEYEVDYDLFNEEAAEAVRLGLAASIEEAEEEALAALSPDMDCVIGPVETGP